MSYGPSLSNHVTYLLDITFTNRLITVYSIFYSFPPNHWYAFSPSEWYMYALFNELYVWFYTWIQNLYLNILWVYWLLCQAQM